ncbi:MAG: RNA-directed DNA polymerase [Planctomycetes bacterium]|nr:RNA-directed DNA polymerase [Planctomycetota bacterium]MBL7040946.1 RNA-directed DNA polymerase [Pirellulaceae bacterium]
MGNALSESENGRTAGDSIRLAEILSAPPERLNEILASADELYRVYPLIKGRKKRWIEAPRSELKRLQRRLLDSVLYRLVTDESAHGFVRGRSIVTNARRHCGRAWVVTMDIRDFFPSIGAERVDRQLVSLPMTEVERENLVRLVVRNGRLPQGAPTSPHLANLVSRRLDLRLKRLAETTGWTYTRYADDLTFSGEGKPGKLVQIVENIIVDEGFQPACRKTRVMSRHQRQVVTGLVVNDKVALPRPKRRLLRAMLHHLSSANQDSVCLPDIHVIHGHLALAALVDPDGYRLTCRQVAQLVENRYDDA